MARYRKDFPDVTTLVNYASPTQRGQAYSSGRECKWAGGYTLADAQSKVLTSDACPDNAMAKAKDLVAKVNATFTGRRAKAWVPSVCGAYPIVADALAGFPTPMRTQQAIEKPTAPLNVYIESSVSAGVSIDELYSRAAAITAFVLKVSQTRPVNLYLFAAWSMSTQRYDEVIWTVKLAGNPVGLYQLMNTMGAVCFNRMVNFNVTGNVHRELAPVSQGVFDHDSYSWAHDSGHRATNLRREFGLTDADLLIERGYLDDAGLFGSDPVAWVHKQVDKYRHTEDV